MADPPLGRRAADRRSRALDRREQSAQSRLAAADERDVSATARDAAASARDEVATARHKAVTLRLAGSPDGIGATSVSEWMIRAAGQRKRAQRMRADSAAAGAFALRDRQIAAQDREQAARERLHALVDREVLADALANAEVDPLTGARMRAAGLADLDRELLCCHRTSRSLVVAYVDVVGLKALNDSRGHAAGDDLLVAVVALLKEHLRAYDLVIRIGGDEFLCAVTGVALAEVQRRFDEIADVLADAPGTASIRTGFAALAPDETTVELIARADGQMLAVEHEPHVPRVLPHTQLLDG